MTLSTSTNPERAASRSFSRGPGSWDVVQTAFLSLFNPYSSQTEPGGARKVTGKKRKEKCSSCAWAFFFSVSELGLSHCVLSHTIVAVFKTRTLSHQNHNLFLHILLLFISSYRRDNWLVAAKRSQRRCFLFLRCRLFLSLRSRIRQVSDCSPANRERELG